MVLKGFPKAEGDRVSQLAEEHEILQLKLEQEELEKFTIARQLR